MLSVQVERLDHLGIMAGVCQEVGLATYLDGLAGPSGRQVSIGTVTTAMILNGLGRFGDAEMRLAGGNLMIALTCDTIG